MSVAQARREVKSIKRKMNVRRDQVNFDSMTREEKELLEKVSSILEDLREKGLVKVIPGTLRLQAVAEDWQHELFNKANEILEKHTI